ncbi:hypothetical protein M3Y96_00079500 [Aphelenchoides besseyi]|nr:hypothetical protein M3Y96_00079500 [Aphelenchoides besseyi]
MQRPLAYLACVLLLLLWPPGGTSNSEWQTDSRFSEFSAGKDEKALFPSIFNLATGSDIRATSTCGRDGPEEYCKLTEHVYRRTPQCDYCDHNNHAKQHPIEFAIDGTKKWWQSPTLSNGLGYEKVNITIDLRQEYQVAYVIVKAGISPRPGTWVLEKSLDGVEFTPWQYYARSDPECMRVFGVAATVGVPRFTSDDEVICTSYYSRLDPMERGEIHTSLVNGRPSAEHPSEILQNFTTARFVRLRLISLRTMNADLMIINRRNQTLDNSVTRRYFYSISDISIGGQCICNGHAETCNEDGADGIGRCVCQHNTHGPSCKSCLPLYNQLPWRPGTHADPNVCEECLCHNHATSCVYDEEIAEKQLSLTPEGKYEGGGRCVDCQHNTVGINCERCADGFYRPVNVSHYAADACRPCYCDSTGAIDNNCIQDTTNAPENVLPGQCRCKEGFGNPRCSQCAPGYRKYPTCEKCPCNLNGLRYPNCEGDSCVCKDNVEGEFCDTCKKGTIYLNVENPLGCQSCFCFGKSEECEERQWSTGLITTNEGWNLTDLYGRLEIPRAQTSAAYLLFNSDDYREQQHLIYYWQAPSEFRGNRLTSYGAKLRYFVYFTPSSANYGHPTPIADLVIEGNGLRLEYHSRINFFPRENISVTVPFKTTDGWFNAETRRPVDKVELMRVLADVSRLLVRARYHQDQLQSSVYGLRLEYATTDRSDVDSDVSSTKLHPVEVCQCPEGYTGTSCESCLKGYRRVGNQLYGGLCEKCNCQGHSDECDPFTGHCINCQHNTTGTQCERCLPGHYGNPSLEGEPGGCKPCACPTIENSHSSSCALSRLLLDGAAAVDQDEYVCTTCETGYDGNHCEICADGFFGDPINGNCTPCDCNGNSDPMEIGNCDRTTGVCLKCTGNTAGDHCERCEDNHWGSALRHDCRPCDCHHLGASSSQCSNDTGICSCLENYTGFHCERCKAGHGDIENLCPECNCNTVGSLGEACDEISGQCRCKPGIYGKACDLCLPGYFDFSENGCKYCQCNEFGSISGLICNNVTGECRCQSHVTGTRCDTCESGYFNLTSGTGCQACECHELGAEDETCDLQTGQCRCKPGVVGLKCDVCAPNHYGLSESGCKQCQVCPARGHVCDSVTGECVCPPNTIGELCEECAPNAWNYDPLRGCQLCSCDGVGADDQTCDPTNGQCKCKAGYVGHTCSLCEPGFFNFPNCEPCSCETAGTEPSQCRDDSCLCSNDGQCKCKKFVTGLKCDECAPNTFSLDRSNPLGCTECFCFNRSDFCVQHNRVWAQMYTPDRRVRFDHPFEYFNRRYNLHILKTEPLNYNSYPTNYTPLYWPLPTQFLGDRTSSYGGHLRFRVVNDDNYRGVPNARADSNSFHLFPQILLVGNHRLELEHIPVEIADDGKYKVRLHESQWRNRIAPQIPVSRKQMMVALQNVQGIYVRGTYRDMYRNDEIALQELSLDVASEDVPGSSNSTALGIESCGSCPEGYSGASCQNPAEGYCRKRLPGYLNEPDELALVGVSERCACNGHSEKCDPETCRCLDCEHNTQGDRCEYCRAGFYGNATTGSSDSCKKCGCPDIESSFSPTCVPADNDRGYRCNACRQGYGGEFCEWCSAGYYGNPTIPGGLCELCACHPFGSKHSQCNNVTGQCDCLEGTGGRDCSICMPRHAFMNQVCTSCDQGCHKELMDLEDQMESQLDGIRDFGGITPLPRKRLSRIQTDVQLLDELLNTITSSEGDAHRLLNNLDGGEKRPLKQADVVGQEFRLLDERNSDSLERVRDLKSELGPIRETLNEKNRLISDTIHQLSHFSRETGGQTLTEGELSGLINQANAHLEQLRNQNELLGKQHNYARKNSEDAQELLRQILAKKLNDTSYEKLSADERQYQSRLKDARNVLWDEARPKIASARDLTNAVNSRLDALSQTISEISRFDVQLRKQLDDSRNNVENAKSKILDLHDHYQIVENEHLPTLEKLRNDLSERLKSEDQTPHRGLQSASEHAKNLEHQAAHLKTLFAATQRLDAVAASTAYSEIVEALRNASEAAEKALASSKQAQDLFDGSDSNSLISLTGATFNQSQLLQRNVLEAQGKDEYVDNTNKRLNDTLAKIQQNLNDADRNFTRIKDSQQVLDDHHDRINTVHTSVDEARKVVDDTQDTVQMFADGVKSLNDRLQSADVVNEKSIQELIANITASTATVDGVVNSLRNVKSRASGHDSEIRDIRKKLNVLQEKIDEAREKAARIRIAVRSEADKGCIREYPSALNPSPSNTISLKYRPALDSPDSLLFLLVTPGTRTQPREYLAIELKAKKIHVRWNVGAGRRDAAIMKRSLNYIPASDRASWYQIDVTRIGNTIRLSVVQRRVSGGDTARDVDEPTEITVGEPDVHGDVVLNTGPNQRVYVGHPSPQLTEELGLSTNKFRGILGEMILDGTNVPLWVFDSSSGDCEGNAGPPTSASVGHLFRNGFAQIRLQTEERANQMVTVGFSAYSKEGLLYFRGSTESRDFLAIQLEDGAIGVRTRIAGQPVVHLQANKTNYADGKAHRIRTIRKDGELHLQVDEDDRVSTVLLSENEKEPLLSISNADHYVGGVPSDYNRQAFIDDDIRFNGFFGCISSVRPTQVTDLDLDHPVRSQRKEPGCTFTDDRLTSNDRIIGFPRAGYLRTRGIELGPTSTFSFNLRTKSPNAMLLYQTANSDTRRRRDSDNSDSSFIAFYLFGGRLTAHLGTRLERPSLTSKHTYNDGHSHSVFLARTPSEIVIRVDDREILSAALEDDTVIGSPQATLLLGGFPTTEGAQEEAEKQNMGTSEPLIGCLSDFYVDYKRLPIIPQEHLATLGSCSLANERFGNDEKTNAEVETNDEPSLHMHDRQTLAVEEPLITSSDPLHNHRAGNHRVRSTANSSAHKADVTNDQSVDGVRFGSTKSSHARINFEEPLPDYNKFKIEFSMRTKQRNGLIWTWANYRNYTRYFFLTVDRGFLKLDIKAHREPKTLRYKQKRVNDDQWHHVMLKKEGRNLWLQVDDFDRTILRDVPNPKVMKKRMFVGGVSSKHRRLFKIPQPGYQGLLKEFRVNDVEQSLSLHKKRSSMDVR